MRSLARAAVTLAFATLPVQAQNLLVNGDFRTDVTGWVHSSAPSGSTLAYSQLDAGGLASSGSAQFVRPASFPAGNFASFTQCVPVTGGGTYSAAVDYLVIPATEAEQVRLAVWWHDDPDCLGASLDQDDRVGAPPADAWGRLGLDSIQAPAAAQFASVKLAIFNPSSPGEIRVNFDNAFFGATTCAPSASALCLNNGRFRVETAWRTPPGTTGLGTGVKLTADTGYFWFFNVANVEMVVKVLTACGVNQRYWVFAGGLTNVEVTWTVTDTTNGNVETYTNPLNAPFQPLQDTDAFACP